MFNIWYVLGNLLVLVFSYNNDGWFVGYMLFVSGENVFCCFDVVVILLGYLFVFWGLFWYLLVVVFFFFLELIFSVYIVDEGFYFIGYFEINII